MKMREDIRPVTYLKSRAADLLDQLNKTHRPVVITQNGEARAVIQDTESYERTKTAIGFLKLLVQGEEHVRSGKTIRERASDRGRIFTCDSLLIAVAIVSELTRSLMVGIGNKTVAILFMIASDGHANSFSLKPALFPDFDHPNFLSEGPTALRT